MNDEYKRALGKVLAAKRKEAKLTKQQLALMVGINRLTIRLVERGKANPTIETLMRITQGLGISFADAAIETERMLCAEEGTRQPLPDPIHFETGQPANTYFLTRL